MTASGVQVVALVLIALLAGGPAPAAPPRSLDETLAAHCRAREATSTLRATFAQTRWFTALGEEERSGGVLYYRKPDALRWEYPDSFTVIRGGQGFSVFPRIRQVQRFEVAASRLGGILSMVGFGECAASFRQSFEFALAPDQDGRAVLSLTPLRAEIASSFERIELLLDRADHLPRAVVLHETSGDRVRLDFIDLRRNVPLDRSLFEFNTPKDYSVVPLSR